MTAAMVESDQGSEGRPWDYLLRTWQELDVPEGWRAEIDEGRSPWYAASCAPQRHRREGQRRLYTNLPEELEIYQTLGVHVAPLDKLYVLDLVVMPAELIEAADPETSAPMDASGALLIVEITSKGNAREDRTKKYRAYARARVPMYLLLDRFDTRGAMATLFTEPNEDGTYKRSDPVPFGKPLLLPAPFDVTLPTDGFPV